MDGQIEDIRIESDSMGEVEIPAWAYWGAQTQRAIANFSVSPLRIPKALIRSLALIKKHAARVNAALGLIGKEEGDAIVKAASEVAEGRWDGHFPIDVFQTGSGTSWNMNANELIANRANEILEQPLGSKRPVHPNDHVNRGQSSNDVIPSAIHIANRMEARRLEEALSSLLHALEEKAREFYPIIKLGRTHLQDAVPIRLGQEFSGFAAQIELGLERLKSTYSRLEGLALGGTAVGTGLNAHPHFARQVIEGISGESGVAFRPAKNRFESIASRDAQLELMGMLSTIASSLSKIANDLRLLSSGPRAGLGEISLPSLQPGSSIMPGKVNPVIPEMMIQVAAHVQGKSGSVSIAAGTGPLELNMMNPLIAHESLSALDLLSESCIAFADRCIRGIKADPERCRYWIDWSLALVTPLAVEIGYDEASKLAYKAFKERKLIREVVLESGILSPERIEELLDPDSMV